MSSFLPAGMVPFDVKVPAVGSTLLSACVSPLTL